MPVERLTVRGCATQARKALGFCPELLPVGDPVHHPPLTLAEVHEAVQKFDGPAAFDCGALLLDSPLIIDYGLQVPFGLSWWQ